MWQLIIVYSVFFNVLIFLIEVLPSEYAECTYRLFLPWLFQQIQKYDNPVNTPPNVVIWVKHQVFPKTVLYAVPWMA